MPDLIAKYAFAPWIRQGLGTQLVPIDSEPLGTLPGNVPRSEINVGITLSVNGTNSSTPLNQAVTILGTGEVKSIDLQSIVRVEPAEGTTSFEPNYFPYIEFYDEDFPWRFSPAMPSASEANRLKPWLFLAVLKESEFTNKEQVPGQLPAITVLQDIFPNFSHLWSIAHVHANQGVSDIDVNSDTALANAITNIQNTNPDWAYSRILSLRKLEASTKYHAFLIPAYAAGVAKGLDPESEFTGNVLQPAWGYSGQSSAQDYPVYYQWTFTTGAQGDFEALATRLVPRDLDSRIGARPMDMAPALNLLTEAYGSSPALANNLNVEGALNTRTFQHVAWPNTNKVVLEKFLNLSEDIKTSTGTAGALHPLFQSTTIDDDPIVLPPVYGKWHAATSRLTGTSGWLNELNLDPQYRVAAGIGSLIIQQNQDYFMDHAWQQVGEIIEANRQIAIAELSKQLTQRLLDKSIKSNADENRLLPLTGILQKKIANTSTESIHASIANSALPSAIQNAAFRKIVRPRGSVAKKLNTNAGVSNAVTGGIQTTIISNLNSTTTPVKSYTPYDHLTIDTALSADMVSGAATAQLAPGGSTIQQDQAAATNSFSQLQSLSGLPSPQLLPSASLSSIATKILLKLEPIDAFLKRITKILKISPNPILQYTPTLLKSPIAYPKFPFTMFDYLNKMSKDFVIPNIELVSDETISLLQTNQRFIEAFMVGLNHEMGREMLWREYPTDQRGSYFRRFWARTDDVYASLTNGNLTEAQKENTLSDIDLIHTWTGSSILGAHIPPPEPITTPPPPPTAAQDKVVLLIRGELLRKFPNTIVYAQKAEYQLKSDGTVDKTKHRLLKEITDADLTNLNLIQFPKFQAKIDPDIYLLGFDLTLPQAKGSGSPSANDPDGSGWFFVLKERSGQIRFGLDEGAVPTSPAGGIIDWDNLTAAQVTFSANGGYLDPTQTPSFVSSTLTEWGKDSAKLAYAIYQDPALVAIHASDMLGNLQ